MIFRESSKGTVKSINMSKPSIEESTVYQYISLPVSGNYTVIAHDIVDGTIITNPSVVYPQILEYILLLQSPTETVTSKTVITSGKYSIYYYKSNIIYYLDVTSSDMVVSSIITTINTIEPTGRTGNDKY